MEDKRVGFVITNQSINPNCRVMSMKISMQSVDGINQDLSDMVVRPYKCLEDLRTPHVSQ